MREFFACHRTPETMRAGLTTLARLAHKAEDTDDDLLSLGVMDEILAREAERPGAGEIFRLEYIRLHGERPSHGESR